MELSYFINLIFIFVLNVLSFVTGICLNSLVILSFWRSAQLRKKLCYFMIMVLSCCDLAAVLTNNSMTVLIAAFYLTETLDVHASWVHISSWYTNTFLGFSLLALLVMNFERYLGTYYPIFHRTSVTKGKLLTLLGILFIAEITLNIITVNSEVFTTEFAVLIAFIFYTPAMLFVNYKLFTIARKSRRSKGAMKKSFSLKNISSCLLAVVCLVVLSIPSFVYVGLRITSKATATTTTTLNVVHLVGLWGKTIISFNCTFNCLIFYWKNKILRTEGMRVIKSLKI